MGCRQHVHRCLLGLLPGPNPALQKAEALGSAMFVMTAVPWGLCALVFACLHLTYPRDRRRVAARRAPAPAPSSPEPRELEDMAGIAAGPSTLRRPRSKNSSPDE